MLTVLKFERDCPIRTAILRPERKLPSSDKIWLGAPLDAKASRHALWLSRLKALLKSMVVRTAPRISVTSAHEDMRKWSVPIHFSPPK